MPHHITKRRQWVAGATWALLFAAGTPSAMATTVNATDTLPGGPSLLRNIHGIPYYPLTQVAPGYVASSQSTLTFSWDTLGAMDSTKTEVSSTRAALITKDLDGYRAQASCSSSKPYDSVTLDDVTHELKGVTMSTEVTMTSSAFRKVSDGGTPTIHGLTISPSDHLVYGTLDGGSFASVPMFTYSNTQLQMAKLSTSQSPRSIRTA
jgi:hypothetical protein